jgi:hypothetical protein
MKLTPSQHRMRLNFCLAAIHVAWPQRSTARAYIRKLVAEVRKLRGNP